MKNFRHQLPLIVTVLILIVLLPALTVQGELKANYSISVVDSDEITKDHWEVYINDNISFIGSSKDAKGFTWDFGEGEPEYRETSTISHIYTELGTFTVTLTVNDDKNNTDTKWGNITLVERPEVNLVVRDKNGNLLAPGTKVRLGEPIIMDASGSKGHISSYTYGYELPNAFLPQINTVDSTYEHTYEAAGTYNVGLRVTDEIGNIDQMEKSEFITIEVQKGGGTSDSGPELPIAKEYIAGAFGVILLIALIGFAYRNGYIGGPVMTGRGSTPSSETKPGPGPGSGPSLNTLMNRPGGTDPILPDPGSFMQDQGMKDFGKPPLEQTVFEVKTCPKCSGKIPITSLDRPLKVVCPACSASFSLKGAPKSTTPQPAQSMGAPATPAPKQDFIYDFKDCPKCKSKIPITSQDRPLKVTCPGCSASFTLKGKSGGSSTPAPAPRIPTPFTPADDTEIVICPACGKAQPVSASASAANCVSCNARFEL